MNVCGLFVVLVSARIVVDGHVLTKRNVGRGKTRYWPNPSNIRVCWQRDGFEDEKLTIRLAVKYSWEAYSALRFTGWKKCPTRKSHSKDVDIRVGFTDHKPSSLGPESHGEKSFMELNVDFKKFKMIPEELNFDCAGRDRTYCITLSAQHEFGHAIGLQHGQNHENAPWLNCKELYNPKNHLGIVGIAGHQFEKLGPYDPKSVMNYCSAHRWTSAQLSPGDIMSVGKIYPPQKNALGKECRDRAVHQRCQQLIEQFKPNIRQINPDCSRNGFQDQIELTRDCMKSCGICD